MKRAIALVLLIAMSTYSIFAQTTLSGQVTDQETGEVLMVASVVISKNGIYVDGVATDFDGHFELVLDPGTYDITASYVGYSSLKITGVTVKEDQDNEVSLQLPSAIISSCSYRIVYFPIALINQSPTHSGVEIDKAEIEQSPSKTTTEIIFKSPGLTTHRF